MGVPEKIQFLERSQKKQCIWRGLHKKGVLESLPI